MSKLELKSLIPEVECKYNPIKDIKPVNQLGVLDLAKAYSTGSIPADISVSDSHFNGVTDPRSLDGRPADVFEAMQAEKAIRGYKLEKDEAGDQ